MPLPKATRAAAGCTARDPREYAGFGNPRGFVATTVWPFVQARPAFQAAFNPLAPIADRLPKKLVEAQPWAV